jgi:hypothetical protein
MTKEWQEATEEYMKVRGITVATAAYLMLMLVLTNTRPRVLSPSPATRV